MKRSGPLKRRTELRRKTRLRPRSKKRERLMEERRALVAKVLLERPRCEFPNCTRRSEQVHEPLSRARGGSIVLESNTVAVCGQCHRYLHSHPAEAEALGLLISAWQA